MGRVDGSGVRAPVFSWKRFSKKQLKVLTWWTDCSPVKGMDGIICDGAVRSGKTVCMALSFVLWAMQDFANCNFAIAGKTVSSVRRNVVADLSLMLRGRGYKVAEQVSKNQLTVTKGAVANVFYLFGGKDESSASLIQGVTLAGVLLDEVALMPQSFVDQAAARCSISGAKLWFNCNPEGPAHWFKREWIDKREEKRMLYLSFSMDDNLSLDERTKERYRTMFSGVFYERFILGKWSAADGIIYDMFNEKRHVLHVLPELDEGAPKYVSCDYGTTNPCCFLLWVKAKTGEWIAAKEYYWNSRERGRQKTDEEYVNDMEKFIGAEKVRYIIIDPSAASFIAALKRRGFGNILAADNGVVPGIRLVSGMLGEYKLLCMDTCKNLIRERGSYAWDKAAALRGDDKPIKQFDHAMDAERYFVSTILTPARKVGTSDLRVRIGI